jgi:hypothetical protein
MLTFKITFNIFIADSHYGPLTCASCGHMSVKSESEKQTLQMTWKGSQPMGAVHCKAINC